MRRDRSSARHWAAAGSALKDVILRRLRGPYARPHDLAAVPAHRHRGDALAQSIAERDTLAARIGATEQLAVLDLDAMQGG